MDGKNRTLRSAETRAADGGPFSWLGVDVRSSLTRSADDADHWSLVELFLVAALWTALDLIAIVLFLRMISGAFTRQIPVGAFAMSLLLSAVTGSLAFILGWRIQDTIGSATGLAPHRNRIVIAALSLMPVLLIGTALAPPLSAIGWGFVGCCWIGTLALILQIGKSQRAEKNPMTRAREPEKTEDITAPASAKTAVTQHDSVEPERLIEETEDSAPDLEADSGEELPEETPEQEEASLWMKRSHGNDRADSLEGMTVAEFLPRQKQITVHLAFCPPFRQTPELVCTPVEDDSVRAKVGVVYPYGARIDLKRSGPATDHATLHIHFSATGATSSAKDAVRPEN